MEQVVFPDPERTVLTVSEVTERIKIVLEDTFFDLWVEGEISNLRTPSSGHTYLTLKDEQSQIRAVLFKMQRRYLRFDPKDGMLVIARGRISLYEPRGEYQLVIDYMEPKGIGALQIAFEQLKTRLAQAGLFDPARKRPLPVLPRCIGIVTSPTGAVIRDMLQILRRRFANLHVCIYPVRVQGDGAAEEIARAIEALNGAPGIEVIIVARGGGSLEDLWAFNEESVARAPRLLRNWSSAIRRSYMPKCRSSPNGLSVPCATSLKLCTLAWRPVSSAACSKTRGPLCAPWSSGLMSSARAWNGRCARAYTSCGRPSTVVSLPSPISARCGR